MELDDNGDGSLTLDELAKGLQENQNGEHLLELLKSADTDGSGEINYTEFLAATMDASLFMREEYLRGTFKMFDKDNSGKIDAAEVVQMLQGEDMTNIVSKDAIEIALQEIDENGDGEIDFEEFMLMMTKA